MRTALESKLGNDAQAAGLRVKELSVGQVGSVDPDGGVDRCIADRDHVSVRAENSVPVIRRVLQFEERQQPGQLEQTANRAMRTANDESVVRCASIALSGE